MAGQAVVSAFMQVLFEKLINVAAEEFNLFKDVQEELHNLTSTLSAIQALLQDAEEKQFVDVSIRTWLAKLKDVAYDMDDLLDDYSAEVILKQMVEQRCAENTSYWRMKLRNSFTFFYLWRNVRINYKFARRVRKIQEGFIRIAKERDNLGLQILGGTGQIQIAYRPQTSSLVDESKVFGREEETQDIVQLLLSLAEKRNCVSILPVVGMGGLGKTTLAQSVYNDKRIKDHFQLRMWVCVSDNFDELKLTNETLNCAAPDYSNANAGNTSYGLQSQTMTNMNLAQQNLSEKLKGKRFLLVLDDVWNEDPNRWDSYRQALLTGETGSAIIVTTRNTNVGRIMGGLRPYHLKQLSDTDCWTLFRNHAFVKGNCIAHPNLEKIGMQIVKKMKGLPLAAKTIGSLLYSKTDEEVWRDILKSETWELPLGEHHILPALRLSYKHLPSHLKQCFAFCSVYHKDFVFQKDKLVKIWIALGFVQAQGKKRLEDIGSSYFDELVARSFFQPYKGSYVMHDAIHDLAQSLCVQECQRIGDGTLVRGDTKKVRFVSLSSNNSKLDSFQEFYKFNKLRTLLLLRGYKSKISQIPDDLFSRLTCLRVLDLHRRGIKELPNSLGNLIQLRYLSIAGTEITMLPPSISRLRNLQTLNLTNCNLLSEIPHGVTNLLNLRHLEATSRLISEIAGIGSLTSLQTLEEFIVRKKKGYTVAELESMAELQGQMHIRNLENVADRKEASKAKLDAKENLKKLCLEWDHDSVNVSLEEGQKDEGILDALQPHHELKELKINGYAGSVFPNWVSIPSFCYLESISLSNCISCQVLPALGQLPLLKYLEIGGFQTLAKIDMEFYGCGDNDIKGFPKLTEFVIQDILQLECWILNEDSKFFPILRELEMADCPKLSKLPHLFPTLTRLRIAETGIECLPKMQNAETLSLSTFDVHCCPNLKTLQSGLLDQQSQLRNLEQLRITDCKELIALPSHGFRNFVYLKSLRIHNCPKLEVWEDGRRLLPYSLKDLQVVSCSKLINKLLTETKDLFRLEHITIAQCHGLRQFPDDALPTSLKVLEISECKNMLNLPARLGFLSLTNLVLINCTEVQCLPRLPSTMQKLRIEQCPKLKSRYKINSRNWSMLRFIPKVEID